MESSSVCGISHLSTFELIGEQRYQHYWIRWAGYPNLPAERKPAMDISQSMIIYYWMQQTEIFNKIHNLKKNNQKLSKKEIHQEKECLRVFKLYKILKIEGKSLILGAGSHKLTELEKLWKTKLENGRLNLNLHSEDVENSEDDDDENENSESSENKEEEEDVQEDESDIEMEGSPEL